MAMKIRKPIVCATEEERAAVIECLQVELEVGMSKMRREDLDVEERLQVQNTIIQTSNLINEQGELPLNPNQVTSAGKMFLEMNKVWKMCGAKKQKIDPTGEELKVMQESQAKMQKQREKEARKQARAHQREVKVAKMDAHAARKQAAAETRRAKQRAERTALLQQLRPDSAYDQWLVSLALDQSFVRKYKILDAGAPQGWQERRGDRPSQLFRLSDIPVSGARRPMLPPSFGENKRLGVKKKNKSRFPTHSSGFFTPPSGTQNSFFKIGVSGQKMEQNPEAGSRFQLNPAKGPARQQKPEKKKKIPGMSFNEETMVTLEQMAEAAGCHYTQDANQGIQTQPRDMKKNNGLVGFKLKLRAFHDCLRNNESKGLIPSRPEGLTKWCWLKSDERLGKVASLMWSSAFSLCTSRCVFNICAGPQGVHACMCARGNTPPLIHSKSGDFLHMMNYEPEARDWSSTETLSIEDLIAKIDRAPLGRWIFLAGKLPEGFELLLPSLETLGLEMEPPAEGHRYVVLVGVKGIDLLPALKTTFKTSFRTGPGSIFIQQNMWKTRRNEEGAWPMTQMGACQNCHHSLKMEA